MARSLANALLLPFRMAWRFLRWLPRAFLLTAVVGLLVLNVASLTIAGVYGLLSAAIELLDPDISIRSKTERRLATLQADLLDADVNLGRLETELSTTVSEKQEIEAALGRAQGSTQNLQNELESKRRQIGELELRVEAADQRAAGLERRWASAIQERDTARGEVRRGAQQQAASEEATRLARIRVDNLTRSIARRGVQVASANVSTMALEAVPYFGIAVNVGATGYELSAACDTAKEMAQIREVMGLEAGAAEEDNSTVCGMEVPTAEELWVQMTTDAQDLPKRACLQAREQGMNLPLGCEDLPTRPDAEEFYEAESPAETPPLDRPE